MVWGLVGGCVMQMCVADELPKDGFAPRLGHAGAALASSLVCSGGNRGQGVRGWIGI